MVMNFFAKEDWIFLLGMLMTFVLVLLYLHYGIINNEPIWAFATVILGHKASSAAASFSTRT